MRKLKICFVLDDTLDSTDGVQQYIITLGQWLSARGHEVHFLAGESSRQDLQNLHSIGQNLKVKFNGNRLSMPFPTSQKLLQKLLQTENFDVIHVQSPFSPWLAGRVIKLTNHPTLLVSTFHILPVSKLVRYMSRLLAFYTRNQWRKFDISLSVSLPAKLYAKSVFHSESIVVPNVFDFTRFNTVGPNLVKSSVKENKKIHLLFLGRLVPRKGCYTLLQAIKILREKHSTLPLFELSIYGKGPLLNQLEKYVIDNNLTDYVKFKGYVEESLKPLVYASADITIFPSKAGESFGIVLLEAMASGNSLVLAGDNPGYASVVGKSAKLFNPTDPQELANLIAYYIKHPKQRQNIAKTGIATVKKFDVNLVGRTIEQIYLDLSAQKNL